MKIQNTHPPKHIWEKAHSMFTLDDKRVVYTYGDTLYNPGGVDIDPALEAHESLHTIQQAAFSGPEKWWTRYFADPKFRYEQELQAYRHQYATFCTLKHDRNAQARFVWEIAKHLASEMYGAGVSHSEAMKAIRS